MKYYSEVKQKELLIHATTWVTLKGIMVSERSLSQKVIYCIIPFIWYSRKKMIWQRTDQ